MPSQATAAAQSTTVIRIAFFAEAIGNVVFGIPMILTPESALLNLITPEPSLNSLTSHPASFTTKANPQAILLTQWFGAVVVGLAAPLLLGALDDPRFIATRRMTYTTLGAMELALVVTMLLQLASRAEDRGLTTTPVLVYGIGVIASLFAWRFYVLTRRPEWVGDADIALRRTPSGKRRSL